MEYETGEDVAGPGQEYEYIYKDYPEGAEPSELGPVLSAETPESGGVSGARGTFAVPSTCWHRGLYFCGWSFFVGTSCYIVVSLPSCDRFLLCCGVTSCLSGLGVSCCSLSCPCGIISLLVDVCHGILSSLPVFMASLPCAMFSVVSYLFSYDVIVYLLTCHCCWPWCHFLRVVVWFVTSLPLCQSSLPCHVGRITSCSL